MADKKWLLGPGPLEPMPLGMNCKPWYRDKLPSKCFAKHKKALLKFPTSLDGRRWVFVKEGLADFRKGCPPCEDVIPGGPEEGFVPVIAHRVPQLGPKKGQRKLPKTANLSSTLSPAQPARKAFVEDIEAHLTEHPLALYPNLEEDLPADLLLKVLEVLDPDRKLKDTWAYCEGPRKRTKPSTKLRKKRPAKVYVEPIERAPKSYPSSLHYKDRKPSSFLEFLEKIADSHPASLHHEGKKSSIDPEPLEQAPESKPASLHHKRKKAHIYLEFFKKAPESHPVSLHQEDKSNIHPELLEKAPESHPASLHHEDKSNIHPELLEKAPESHPASLHHEGRKSSICPEPLEKAPESHPASLHHERRKSSINPELLEKAPESHPASLHHERRKSSIYPEPLEKAPESHPASLHHERRKSSIYPEPLEKAPESHPASLHHERRKSSIYQEPLEKAPESHPASFHHEGRKSSIHLEPLEKPPESRRSSFHHEDKKSSIHLEPLEKPPESRRSSFHHEDKKSSIHLEPLEKPPESRRSSFHHEDKKSSIHLEPLEKPPESRRSSFHHEDKKSGIYPEPLEKPPESHPASLHHEDSNSSIYSEPPEKAPESHRSSLHRKDRKSSRKDSLTDPRTSRKIPKGIRQFCKWVATFGDLGIDEEFIMKKCEVKCECPPTYGTGCIKKVTKVPSEVKHCIGLNEMEERKFSIEERNWERKLQKPENPYKPNWVKMRYGAWYLKPKLWKKLINDEPLTDPKGLLGTQGGCFGRRLPEQDILEDLYGTIAFKDYILSKGYEMPDILERLFIRKGWTYDSVKTPIQRVIKMTLNKEEDTCEDG
ncbi:protein FAM47A-like [Camelus ferus]|uniref:Protein FAM47A-like n=1 Tax=Camelus ferus TaxID=419612 RepID=A0A8B8SMB0_CAMFR|nr:protein FAM47A-like [Camelus ferus]